MYVNQNDLKRLETPQLFILLVGVRSGLYTIVLILEMLLEFTYIHSDTLLHILPLIKHSLAALFLASLRRCQPRRIHKKLPHKNKHCKSRRQPVKNAKKNAESIKKQRRRKKMKMKRARKAEFPHAKWFHTSL